MAKVAITGHRPTYFPCGYNEQDPWILNLRERLSGWLKVNDVELMIDGMALGFDQIAVEEAIKLKIPFDAYIPFKGQGKNWPLKSREKYNNLLGYARRSVLVSEEYSNEAFFKRDERMVDDCDLVLALWNPEAQKGGTFHTVSYAKSKGKEIVNFWE